MPNFFCIFFRPETTKYEAVNGPNPDLTFTGVDGTDAARLASEKLGLDGKYVAFSVAGALTAYLLTQTGVVNTDIAYTAKALGPGGNSIRVRYVVAGNNTALSVTVAGSDITVNLATGGSGAPTSTATQVRDAANASGPASALVVAALAPSVDGTGIVPAMAYTNLARGTWGEAVAINATHYKAVDAQATSF